MLNKSTFSYLPIPWHIQFESWGHKVSNGLCDGMGKNWEVDLFRIFHIYWLLCMFYGSRRRGVSPDVRAPEQKLTSYVYFRYYRRYRSSPFCACTGAISRYWEANQTLTQIDYLLPYTAEFDVINIVCEMALMKMNWFLEKTKFKIIRWSHISSSLWLHHFNLIPLSLSLSLFLSRSLSYVLSLSLLWSFSRSLALS